MNARKKTRKCPTPGKKRFRDRKAAMDWLIQKTSGRLRPYRCPCGAFHLSSHGRTVIA